MYNHILFFGYMVAAFSALVAILIIIVVQKHDTDKKGLYKKTRNFIIVSFLVEFNYFLSFYKEALLENYAVGPVWRLFDYTVWIAVYFFWIVLVDELGGNKLAKFKKIYGYITVVAIILFGIGCIFFMNEYYIVDSEYGRIYLFIVSGLFAVICLFTLWKFLYKSMQETPTTLPRNYVIVVTIMLVVLHITHLIVDCKLYLGLYGYSGWDNQVMDPVWLVFMITNIATIMFVYKVDFSPVYYGEELNSGIDLPSEVQISHEEKDVIKLNKVAELHRLTQREREVLFLAYTGMTNPEISESLYISRNTVKKHMHSIFEKLDVSTRMEIVHLVNSQKTQ